MSKVKRTGGVWMVVSITIIAFIVGYVIKTRLNLEWWYWAGFSFGFIARGIIEMYVL